MALIACPKCARQVSDRAKTCPHCRSTIAQQRGQAQVVVTRPPGQPVANQGIETGKRVAQIAVFVLIGLFFCFKWFGGAAHNPSSANSSDPLPSIRVLDTDGALSFTNWHTKGYNLYANLVWNGSRKIDAITYTTRRNGVVKQRGDVMVPGDGFVKGEPVEACLLLWEDPEGLDVTVEVAY